MDTVRHWGRAAPYRLPLSALPFPQTILGLAILALVVAHQLGLTTQTQALTIRHALVGAAAATATLPATETSDEVRAALRPYFPDRDTKIDAQRFPSEVDVTVANLDRRTCLEAERIARRIVGPVVIQLDGYGSAGACGDHNAMTWRIQP